MPDAAKPATDEQIEELRAYWEGHAGYVKPVGGNVSLESLITRITVDAAEIKALREFLAPFAAVAEHDIGTDEADADLFRPMASHNRAPKLTVGDLRRARALLEPSR